MSDATTDRAAIQFSRGYGRRVHIVSGDQTSGRYRDLCLCGNYAHRPVADPAISSICKQCLKSAKASGLLRGEPCKRCGGSGVEP